MGQTNTDKLISPIVGKAVTTEFDLDARIDALEAAVPATEVTYTVADTNDWPGADPVTAAAALDNLAARVTDQADAGGITYTPAVLADWNGAADPGDVDNALDQLAERVTDQRDAGGITFTPTVVTDWDGNADPGDLDDALNQLAERVDDVEVATGVGYTPADGTAWADPDPTAVNGALDDLALTRQSLRKIETSVGAEAANVIAVTITVTNGVGAALSSAVRLKIGIYTDDVCDTIAAKAAFTLSDGGDGSLLSEAAANAVYVFETSATGVCVVNVTDVATASGLTRHLLIELFHTVSPAQTWAPGPLRQSVTFDGV